MSAFGKAFNAARRSGKKTFSFGGKSYNTKVAATTPKKGPVPQSRPDTTTKTASAPKAAPARSGVGKALNAMANSSSVSKYTRSGPAKKPVQGPPASAKQKTPSAKDYPANMSSRKSISNDQARYNMSKAPLSIADRINRQATAAIQAGLAASKAKKRK